MATLFTVSEAWRAAYPGAAVGVLAMADVANPEQCPALDRRKEELEQELRTRFAGRTRADIVALPVLKAYDAYYRRFKKTYHVQLQLESVALKGKSLPRVAALVEAMFAAELQSLLLTAGHDLDTVVLPAGVDVATGREEYTLINGQPQVLKPGDMFIADRQGVMSSIIYGPDARTRLAPGTRRALFTTYAPPGVDADLVAQHLRDIQANVLLVAPAAKVEELAVYS